MSETTIEIPQQVQQLGKELSQTPQMHRFYKAHEAYEADEEARGIMKEWQNSVQQAQLQQQMGQPVDEDALEAQKKQLHDHPVIGELIQAQEEMQALLTEVNRQLSETAGFDVAAHGKRGGCC